MRKIITLGIGLLIVLLALAGTGSAKSAYSTAGAECGFCHVNIVNGDYTLTSDGSYFRDIHKFDGNRVPPTASSCLTCHPDLTLFLPLTSVGSNYSKTHRYNATTLAAKMLPDSGCANCHMNAIGNNFNLLTGTPTYLTSTTCMACHKAKYDNWSNTLHAVMLTPADKAQAMNIPEPEVGWAGISYVIVTKFEFAYINTTGYFLAPNDAYETENQTFADSSHAGGKYGTCGRCHTTGWNASATNTELPGFTGTLEEPGIACERCHGAGGNGHQVVVNYSGDQCRECHTGGNHGTGWELGTHAPPPYSVGTNCVFCHSAFDGYKNQNVTEEEATGVSCGVCHNTHDMTDAKYAATFTGGTFNATIWSQVADSKLAFFNATSSSAAGTDIFDDLSSISLLYPGIDSSRKDSSYGTDPINVTGRPDSEKLCSICHYRHGLDHMSGVQLSHASGEATCVDCHMGGANANVGKDMMKKHDNDPLATTSCGTAKCHSSMTTLINEWKESAHNVKEVGVGGDYNHFYGIFNATTGVASSRANSCLKCKSPKDWNPATPENITTTIPLTADFNGITCGVCHNLHDMGNWLTNTEAAFGVPKPYAWYNRDAIFTGTRYKANYTMTESTTELCGNCHSNIRYGNTGPGWASATSDNPIKPHGYPAKDLFVGSWKESGLLKFECVDCHFATLKRDASGNSLPADQRILGHSFKVNATLLQSNTACSTCHVTGGALGNLSTTIETIQDETHAKWNNTNAIVQGALATYKAYSGEKNVSSELIARAYWNIQLVSSDESWGVHNPSGINDLLDQAAAMAITSNESLGDVTYVDCTRSGPGSGSFIDPYPSIQDGINSAIGTLVKVASGTCIENVDLKNGIFLLGAGADITTIEGNVMAWNVHNTRISNFTITDNDTAGIHSYNSTLTITNNIIRDQPHNGIHSSNSLLTIFNNVLSGNGHNGILLINQSSAFLRNNIIVHNGQFGVGSDGTHSAIIDYNDFWNNTLGGSGSGGTHDLNLDPQFISSSDFRLQPASPAINAGDPNSNYNDADGSRNDMGAFGGHIITKSEAHSAQFAINKNFVVGTDLDSLNKGIYNRDLNYNLDINNLDETSDTVMGNIRFDAKADNITNVDWREYATWNKTSANWTYPTDRLIYENEGFGTGFNTNYSESRILNVSIYRWMNNTNFSTNGYQLVMFNATFENTNFEWAWARIEANNRNEVNVSIIENTFTKDVPGNYSTWENGIQFDFDKNSIQPGKVYNFSVVVKVDLTGREAPPIEFKPQFSIGMGTYYNSTVSQGFKAKIPAGMLPDKISYASASSNVNNAWLLKRHDHNIAQLEEVSRIAHMTVTNPSANQSDIPDDTDNVPLWGETARLNITVTDPSIIASVTVNLSEIGGPAAKPMTNIGGNIYSTTTNASAGTLPKLYNLTVSAIDTFGNSNTSVRIELRVRKNGDTNGNNAVNIGDALRLANNVSYPGNPTFALSSIYLADVSGNGVINIGDALRLANNVSYPGNLAYMLK